MSGDVYDLRYALVAPPFGKPEHQVVAEFRKWYYRNDAEEHEAMDAQQEMRKFCTDQFGIRSWKWNVLSSDYNRMLIFKFDNVEDAMLFKLRFQ